MKNNIKDNMHINSIEHKIEQQSIELLESTAKSITKYINMSAGQRIIADNDLAIRSIILTAFVEFVSLKQDKK